MTDPEILLAATRYEKIRKLSAGEYSRIWNDCLANKIHFDDAIDALPEPFRVKMREKATFGCNGYEQANDKLSHTAPTTTP